ncbi:MAG: DNA primase [Oligoflexia bacterium]|nr:DNA primase [Oligoflexia bacterium]
MKFSPDFVDQVRDSNNLVDIVSQYSQLTRAGASLKGLCPFPGHMEKTPSFFVSESKQLYHCFGCKKSGNIFSFLMDMQGLSFPEAVEAMAQRARIPLPQKTQPSEPGVADKNKISLKLNKFAAAHYHRKLLEAPAGSPIKAYLQSRGLTDEIISIFKLGYSEPGWQGLTNTLIKARAPLELAESLGLIKKKSGGGHFDIFRDRLMFPIISNQGHVLGFGGRSLSDEQQPKYLNSPESSVFHKGKTFYGLHETAKYVRSQGEALLVEGYMDLVSLYQFGFKNVVAALGTAFTLDHAKALKRMCDRVVVLFDGDAAGQAAADKSLPLLLEAGLVPRLLTLPNEQDPDDYLRQQGPESFKALMESAPDHFMTLMTRLTKSFRGQPSEKVEILKILGPVLGRVTDQRLRILYQRELSGVLLVDDQMVSSFMGNVTSQVPEIKKQNEKLNQKVEIPAEEEVLVQFMLQEPRHLEAIRDSGVIEKFVSLEARQIGEKAVERYCQNPSDFDRLAASLLGEGLSAELLTNHIGFQSGLDRAGEVQLIQDCLNKVRQRHSNRESKQILTQLKANPEMDTEKLQAFMKIAKEQKGPKAP